LTPSIRANKSSTLMPFTTFGPGAFAWATMVVSFD
jgi:hypothetical protein